MEVFSHSPMNEVRQANDDARKVYYVKNERMGGTIASYDAPKSQGFSDVMQSYSAVKSAPQTSYEIADDGAFGFFDILDMVNPLQHIPLVNFAYRGITGDEIKPIGKIIGGGIFGGPVGAASGLVTSIALSEIKGNKVESLSFAENRKNDEVNKTEQKIYDDLPVALLSFAERPFVQSGEVARIEEESVSAPEIVVSDEKPQRVQVASGRTAGTIAVYA